MDNEHIDIVLSHVSKSISHKLYDGNEKIRIAQETILGIAGIRVLQAAGYNFDVVHMNEGHDSTNALLGYLNDPLYNFIRTFYDKGWLENTFIVFMSDHGSQLPGPWTLVNSQDYIIEKTLGSLFFMIPNDNRLYSNERYAS